MTPPVSSPAVGHAREDGVPHASGLAVGVTGLIRVGVFALPLAGALKLVGNLGTFNSVGSAVPQPSEAATITTLPFVAGEFVGSVLPVVAILGPCLPLSA
ncbi:MAG: hypothetical protein ACRDN9_09170 [Streptosporangiaceae bacterium]